MNNPVKTFFFFFIEMPFTKKFYLEVNEFARGFDLNVT